MSNDSALQISNAKALKRLVVAELRLSVMQEYSLKRHGAIHGKRLIDEAKHEWNQAVAACLYAGKCQLLSEPDEVIAEEIANPA